MFHLLNPMIDPRLFQSHSLISTLFTRVLFYFFHIYFAFVLIRMGDYSIIIIYSMLRMKKKCVYLQQHTLAHGFFLSLASVCDLLSSRRRITLSMCLCPHATLYVYTICSILSLCRCSVALSKINTGCSNGGVCWCALIRRFVSK